MSKFRNSSMDVAKGLGIIAVIVGHIWGGTTSVILCSFHLPLFFLITGYFLNVGDSFKLFVVKKIKGYLIPYICCAAILCVFQYCRSGLDVVALQESVVRLTLQQRSTTLWFLAVLFCSVIIFGFLIKLLHGRLIPILLVSFVLSGIFMMYAIIVGKPLIWNLDTAFISLLYIATGYFLREKQVLAFVEHKCSRWKFSMMIVLAVISLGCTWGNYFLTQETYEMFRSRYGFFPLTVLAAVAGSFSVLLLSSFLQNSDLLKWLGRNSMAFFAFHQDIAMTMVYWICSKIPILNDWINPYMLTLNRCITLVGTFAICGLMHRIIIQCRLGFMIGKK